MTVDRQFRLPRQWSNQELRRIGALFGGDIINVSGWEDSDKEGDHYRRYFSHAGKYALSNFRGERGYGGMPGELDIDLSADLAPEFLRRFDVAFNHTTLEHIFEVRKAFANICAMSRDVVIVVVPFAQVQHERSTWGDFWRFTPSCMRRLFSENGLDVVYESCSPHADAGVYLFFVGSRRPNHWRPLMPPFSPLRDIGDWIGGRRSPLRVLMKRFVSRFS